MFAYIRSQLSREAEFELISGAATRSSHLRQRLRIEYAFGRVWTRQSQYLALMKACRPAW
jgi:hypothetical protein